MINFAPFLFYFHVAVALAIIKFHFVPPEFSHGLFPLLAAAELLPHSHLLDGLPAALLAICPSRRCRDRRQIITALHCPAQLNESACQLTYPTLVRFHTAGAESHGPPVGEQRLQIFFEEGLVVETAVPALPPVGTGEGDVLPGIRLGHLVTLVLHILNKTLPINGVLQGLIDGLDQIQRSIRRRSG